MAHRNGSGKKIEDIAAHAQATREAGRTNRTYCSQREWDAWTETIGPKVAESSTRILLRHCTIKGRARGGTYFICHNCLLLGPKDKDPKTDELAFAFYPDEDLDTLTARLATEG